jgi:hypothetical protein
VHYAHPYPGTLARHIPAYLLGPDSPIGITPGSAVLDPFCGGGTTLLEAMAAGMLAEGWDTNPLAHLMARVKASGVHPATVAQSATQACERARSLCEAPSPPGAIDVDYWYSEEVRDVLSRLSAAVADGRDTRSNRVLQLALSRTSMSVSLANPRYPVPVRLRPEKYPAGSPVRRQLEARVDWLASVDVYEKFRQYSTEIAHRISHFRKNRLASASEARVLCKDARFATVTGPAFDVVLTSPPYPGAQKYTRFSSLSLGWLGALNGTSLQGLEKGEVGREHFRVSQYTAELDATGVVPADRLLRRLREDNPLRAHIGAAYLIDMRQAIETALHALRPGGHLILISSPSSFGSAAFNTPLYLRRIGEQVGFESLQAYKDPIRSRKLSTARQNGKPAMPHEVVDILIKPECKT